MYKQNLEFVGAVEAYTCFVAMEARQLPPGTAEKIAAFCLGKLDRLHG